MLDRYIIGHRFRAWIQVFVGLGFATAGVIVSYLMTTTTTRVVWSGAIVVGIATTFHGVWRLLAVIDRQDAGSAPTTGALAALPAVSRSTWLGYRGFVAWRYLLEQRRKISPWVLPVVGAAIFGRLAMWLIFGDAVGDERITIPGIVEIVLWTVLVGALFWGVLRHKKLATYAFLATAVAGIGTLVTAYVLTRMNADDPFALDDARPMIQGFKIAALVSFILAGIVMFFGSVRAVFTFFTTVPIGGVWIGTAALVMVLSVMSGFESDLRQKILGSNAHLQITKEDGDFTGWEAKKAAIDAIPGVVASTPYAMSEVVIAANNNPGNVIIKGIDPATVGKVTDLVNDIEEDTPAERAEAMKRLEPLITDEHEHERTVPQTAPKPSGDVMDPAPPDLPQAGTPIDFSGGPDAGSGSAGSGSAGSGSAGSGSAGSGSGSGSAVKIADDFGGDARTILGSGSVVVDKLDLKHAKQVTDDAKFDNDLNSDEGAIRVLDPFDTQNPSKRTQSLPGILVGKELVKQTRLFVGQEVRVVSPLSDPANPDATGTPIPFNRDFRVAGKFYTGMYEYDLKYVYVTLDALSAFLDRGDAIDGIEVRIGDPDDTDAFIEKIQNTLGPGYKVVDWKELNRSLFSALKLEKIAMFLVLGIVILVASFSIVGNLIMVVVEKAREIALLKTLGASDFGVMQLFAIQGLMIGLIGTVLGVLTGLAGCWAGKRFGLPLDPNVYYIDRLPIHVELSSVVAASAAGILISIAATLYPALLAARVRPAAGMRH